MCVMSNFNCKNAGISENRQKMGISTPRGIDFGPRLFPGGSPVFAKRQSWADRVFSTGAGFALGTIAVAVPMTFAVTRANAHRQAAEAALVRAQDAAANAAGLARIREGFRRSGEN